MSRCPLIWIAVAATAALSFGVDRVYVGGASLVALCVSLAIATGGWIAAGSWTVAAVVAAATAFYGVHCKPLAQARRAKKK